MNLDELRTETLLSVERGALELAAAVLTREGAIALTERKLTEAHSLETAADILVDRIEQRHRGNGKAA